jgi:repressor LexA
MEESTTKLRPTKKQRELLSYIESFIAEHGYSPSYREIMGGLQYTSVATVSLHVNNLIRRGHLKKRDRSARSLEVVEPTVKTETKITPKQLKTSEAKWLVEKVEQFFKDAEATADLSEQQLDKLYVLIGALKVLGLDGAASAFISRLGTIKKKHEDHQYVT